MDTRQTPQEPGAATGGSGYAAYVIVAVSLTAAIAVFSTVLNGMAAATALLGEAVDWGASELSLGAQAGEGALSDLGKVVEKDEGALGVTEALDHDIAPWYLTVDSLVDATEYSGVPADVTAEVRQVVRDDSEASADLVRSLRAAAREGEDTAARMDEAIAVCDAQVEALGEPADSPVEGMDDLREACLARWQAIRSEVALVAAGDVDLDELQKADDAVTDATTTAAEACLRVLDGARR